ncbi:DNA repair protein [Wickerhamomyces ciferrii]|uniref:DNA repair protein n=1 Tax=Wickerhamomyces ciferrii (strain ATCC 14091 / BCRC 22168 / CBS 111 / JCM 3599 / NBRC 0793 / NRRL Y-1031 F-60-10) TaxID=1206466 RepID=K0KF06_WICCF|nr:DNA repair protein [Wickerhamomyces ciferrii]CCH40777.1 DNA repair protein [Wickerhamomyces ciferrii]
MSSSSSENEDGTQPNRNNTGNNNNNNHNNWNNPLEALNRILSDGTASLQETNLNNDNDDNDTDVLFSGTIAQGIPGFSVTIGRTNISNNNINGPTTEDPVFNINNIPNNLREIVETFLRDRSNGSGRNKKATKDAIKHLKIVEPLSLKESDRICSICYEDYDNVEIKNNEDEGDELNDENNLKKLESIYKKTRQIMNDDPEILIPHDSLAQNYSKYQRFVKEPDHNEESDQHIPVQMPCGHIFGRSCLIEWLKEHVSCPFCRREVEAQSTKDSKSKINSAYRNPRLAPANWAGDELNLFDDPQLPFPHGTRTTSNRGNFSFFGNSIFN